MKKTWLIVMLVALVLSSPAWAETTKVWNSTQKKIRVVLVNDGKTCELTINGNSSQTCDLPDPGNGGDVTVYDVDDGNKQVISQHVSYLTKFWVEIQDGRWRTNSAGIEF